MLAVGLVGTFLRDHRNKPPSPSPSPSQPAPLLALAQPTKADREAKRKAVELKKAMIKLQRRGQARPKVLFDDTPDKSFWGQADLHRALSAGSVLNVFPDLSQRFTKVVKVRTLSPDHNPHYSS